MKKSNTQGTERKEEMLDRTLKPEQIEELETQGKLRPEEVKVTLEEAKAIAKEAYIYGFPMVMNCKTVYDYVVNVNSPDYKGPFNQRSCEARLFTPDDKTVVTPNSDTPYCMFWMDLRAEPQVISVPEMEPERFYHIQLIDWYTHNYAYIGTRTNENKAGKYLLVGPNWKGEKPEGIKEVIKSETNLIFAVIRTQLFNEQDLEKVKEIQDGYDLQTVSAFLGKDAPAASTKIDFPEWVDKSEFTIAAFEYLDFALDQVDTHPDEVEFMERLAKIGIGTPEKFNLSEKDSSFVKALEDGVKEAHAEMKAFTKEAVKDPLLSTKGFGTRKILKEGASYFNQPNFYILRAVAAQLGLYGNSGEEAVYIGYFYDKDGKPFDAAENNYILKFEKGNLPPVNAFWSLSMYDGPTQLFIHNPLNRYLLNSTMKDQFVKEEDGSIVLYIQKDSPGKDKEPNWLPAPDGPFYLVLRLYSPQPEILEGKWKEPSLDEIVTVPVTAQTQKMKMTTPIPGSITTPDKVETSIGTLAFFDGAPTQQTAQLVFDNLDRMHGVEAFLKGMPGASIYGLYSGQKSIGDGENHQVVITENLLDSKSFNLTANTSTLYATPFITTKEVGPVVIEIPAGVLGAFNDMWFRYVKDVGPLGPDKGQGGKYLVLPPDYEGEAPEGYFVVKPKTYRVWLFMRGSIANGLEAAVKNIKDNLKIYALTDKDKPPKMEFSNGSGLAYNTIHANDFHFYVELNEVIQYEPLEMIDAEIRGLFASIGIVKGQPFNPDERMKKLLTEAVAIGNATARSIVWYPRVEGAHFYPDSESSWVMAYAGKNVFFERDGAMNSEARVMFHYPYTAVTPAMAVSIPGKGSDYAIAFLDADKNIFDGSKTYKLHIPANVPVNNFWAVTIYDSQTRSLLQTNQQFPTVGSQSEGFVQNEDGSYDVYFSPQAPDGKEHNWLQTIPGKSWFTILRMYGPLEPWINKTWRPGEVELVK